MKFHFLCRIARYKQILPPKEDFALSEVPGNTAKGAAETTWQKKKTTLAKGLAFCSS